MVDQNTEATPPPWLQAITSTLASYRCPIALEEGHSLLTSVSVTPEVAAAWARYDRRFYTRTTVFKNVASELIVMGWVGGQMSPLHNHRGSICVLKVLAGEAVEVGYSRSDVGLFTPRTILRNQVGYLSASVDEDVHQVGNDKSAPLVTLHLYSPPLHKAEWFPQTHSILVDHRSAEMAAAEIELARGARQKKVA